MLPGSAGEAQLAYGVEGGYDFSIAPQVIAGATASYSDSNDSFTEYRNTTAAICTATGRSLTAGVRAGVITGRCRSSPRAATRMTASTSYPAAAPLPSGVQGAETYTPSMSVRAPSWTCPANSA